MSAEIIVVTAAYGYEQVKAQGGQQVLLPLIQQAGADGVEIRRELFEEQDLTTLAELAEAIIAANLFASYSVPDSLFCEDGSLNPLLGRYLEEAQQLKARRLKIALGHFTGNLPVSELINLLQHSPVDVAVENDQTPDSKLAPTLQFFNAVKAANLPISMTFDIGNWSWTGEDGVSAAQQLRDVVSYIHVKATTPHRDSFRAVALDDADDNWLQQIKQLPTDVPRGIEFPLEGEDLLAVTRHYVTLLRNS